jgi:uncharacterized membrane protein YczE
LDTYHVVLYIHLLSLFIGIGAGAVLLACLFQLRAARTVEQAAPWGIVAGKVGKLFPIAIVGLFGSGAYMTSSFAAWSWSHPGLWVVEFSNLGIVMGVVWNMTQKPGLGGSLAAVLVGYAVGATLALLVTRTGQEELAAAPDAAA